MAGRQLGRLAARARNVLRPHEMTARAAAFAAQLKTEYEAGLRGDHADGDPTDDAHDADDVADALRTIDWATVKAATSKGAGEAAERMRAMAQQVDWQAVQPVAAQVSSALIAAVASGQIPLGGPLTGRVARTIMNDQNLAQRVADALDRTAAPMPPDFRGVIDTTGTEA